MSNPLPTGTESFLALEPFSRVKIIVADLDGTLLHPQKVIIERISTSIKRLRRSGVRFSVSTGRALLGVQGILPGLPIPPTTPISLYNGSYCTDVGGTHAFRRECIPPKALQLLIGKALDRGLGILCYPAPILGLPVEESQPIAFGTGDFAAFVEPNGYSVRWRSIVESRSVPECLAALLICQCGTIDGGMRDDFDFPGVSLTTSGGSYLEVRPAGSNKGKSLRTICEYFGISLSECLVIGDNDNDIEMFEIAGFGVAVGNCSERLRIAADYHTKLNSAQGCLETMRMVMCARRFEQSFSNFEANHGK